MTDELEDRRLVKRLLAHDDEAFNEFFEGYFLRLYRFARTRLGDDPDVTKEIVHVTLTKAIRKLLISGRGRAVHVAVHDLPQRNQRSRRARCARA